MTTWGELFDYVSSKVNFREVKNEKGEVVNYKFTCFNDHTFLKQFCKKNKIKYSRIKEIVACYGGHCDCEILFNVEGHIADGRRITK